PTSGFNQTIQVMQFGTGTWRTLTGASRGMTFYPMLHLAPNGQVFYAGPETVCGFLDTSGAGAWNYTTPSTVGLRDYGCSVLYGTGKIINLGGGNFNPTDPNTGTPTNTAEVIDITVPSPTWRLVAPMSYARRQCNALLLPDGTILVTGGTNGPGFNDQPGAILAAELWDPVAETWKVLAGMSVGRTYHSETVLLPDGRVLSQGGGHGGNGIDTFNAEVYSPPYLFKGPRPGITSAPTIVIFGQNFTVQTPDAASVASVTLLATSSVTHSTNMHQRILRPAWSAGAGSISVTAPSDPNLCPPGPYLLFLLDARGVPSVGQMMNININHPPVARVVPNFTAEATGPGGAVVTLDGRGSTDPDNNISTYQWFEGMNLIATGALTSATLSLGTHTITLQVTDAGALTSTANLTVTVSDTTPPTIQSLSVVPDLLRSLTDQLVGVTVQATATDLVDPAPTLSILSVSSTEAVSGLGAGDLTPDWQITPPMTLSLRSERFTYVRRYTITVQAADASGNTSTRTTDARVRGKWFP
ncbi:MAG TPA: galactose oxidase-like domain-containing protein, partial [Thermoplasmata archaeon]|nr:galactose oxidase-like domain-containing protein [Thermoplasmata archaeon]